MTDQTLPVDPPFERKIHRGLMTPRAYVTAIIDDLNTRGDIANAHGLTDWSAAYAEPGYTDPSEDTGILFGNWNDKDRYDAATHKRTIISDKPSRFSKIAEYVGYEVEWHDEWTTCSNCYKALRTSPDSYGWKRAYTETEDCEILCEECTLEDPRAYLESLEDSPDRACTLHVNPADHGYIKINEDRYENGMHPGQNDSPNVIAKTLRAHGVHRFLFVIASVGQFDLAFDLYVHEEERASVPTDVTSALDYDIATELSKVLRGEHSDHYTVTTKRISQEDFINGKL